MRNLIPLAVVIFITHAASLHAQVNFGASGLAGVNINNPTSVDFGPDDRFYVSLQSGEIHAYNVQRNGNNDYQVTQTEIITAITQIQNHNDDGTLHNTQKRQITGIQVVGTPSQPVIYVTSSDYRIGGGGGGADKNLGTNSGVISKLTKNGNTWQRVDLVRGLPRSEENHSTNGLQIDTVQNILYVASGGHTNAGAPSNNFAFLTEYALSACILRIDLSALQQMPVQFDASTNSQYVYDLPTLDDPTRPNVNGITNPNDPNYNGIDINDPFGGNDGLNQAKWTPGSPVQVHASGFRNPYDVVLTQDGRLYTWDNGANSGWGGHPDNEGVGTATNNWVAGEPGSTGPGPNDGMVNNKDGLHFITAAGYYGGHPAPVRANPSGAGLFTHDAANGSGGQNGVWRTAVTGNPATTLPVDWPPVDASLANPIEGDFQNAGVDDPSLFTVKSSTNGLTEYRASNFNGLLQGNLLAASFNGNLYNVQRNAAGSINSANDVTVLATGFGSVPLDVTAQGDQDIFPGTIWAATYGSNAITVFEPQDFSACDSTYSFTIDSDNDGYSNADEIDNGTNPCNGAETPDDFDQSLINGMLVSNLNDPDDDDDGINDALDVYPWDAQNGTGLKIPFDYPLLNGDPGFGFFGLGFTGLMNDGQTDYLQYIKDEDNSATEIIAGGAVGLFTLNNVPAGSMQGAQNSLKNGFQFGLNATQATAPFEIDVALLGPLFQGNPQGSQFTGFYLGSGDQDNYLLIAVDANNGNPLLRVTYEEAGVDSTATYFIPNLAQAAELNLLLRVDPIANTVQPRVDVGNGAFNVAAPLPLNSVFNALQQNAQGLAVGLASGKASGDSSFNVNYDYIKGYYVPHSHQGNWQYVNNGSNCAAPGNPGSCPQGRHEAAYVQVGDKFVLIGGREQGSNANIYDPATNTWTIGSAPGMSIHHFQAVAYDGLVYIVGAMTGNFPNETPLDKILIYNPETDQWINGPEIPVSRRRGSAGCVVYQDEIYLVGGIQNGHLSGWVNWLDKFDPRTNTWTTLPDAPRARDHFHAAVHQGKLYAAGGRRSGKNGTYADTEGKVDVYDFATQTWDSLPNAIPTQRAGAAVAVLGNELLVIGGVKDSGKAYHNTEALNLSNNTWRSLDTLQTGRHGTQAIVNNGGVYLASGSPVRGAGQLLSQEVFFMGPTLLPVLNTLNASQLSASQGSINFGQIQQGNTDSATVYLRNSAGNQAVVIQSAQGSHPQVSSHTTYGLPYHLAPGDSLALTVHFSATGTNLSDTLWVKYAGNDSLAIALNGSVETPNSIYINAGGGAYTATDGTEYQADQFFNNGKVFSESLAIANTADDALYQTERYDANLSYSIPAPNGSYLLQLHFAEIFNGAFQNGTRVFDIVAEGNTLLDNFDIHATAGAATAIIQTFNVNVSDGSLDINLVASADNAKLSALALIPAATQFNLSPTAYHFQSTALLDTVAHTFNLFNGTAQSVTVDSINIKGSEAADFSSSLSSGFIVPAGQQSNFSVSFHPQNQSPVVRKAVLEIYTDGQIAPDSIALSGEAGCTLAGTPCDDGDPNTVNDVEDGNCNCSGTPVTNPGFNLHVNAGGPTYTALDGTVYSSDNYYTGGNTFSTTQPIAGSADDALYQTERWNDTLLYNLPVPADTTYWLNLHFAEIYSGVTAPGQRVFDIWVEDSLRLSGFDIFAEAGSNTALQKGFFANVTDGNLQLSLIAQVDNAKLSAISITDSTPAPAAFLQPGSLSLGSLNPGDSSQASSYLVNQAGQNLIIDSVTLGGTHSSDFKVLGISTLSVNDGDSATLSVQFKPQGSTPGQRTAQLKVWSNSLAQPLVLALNGTLTCPVAGTTCDDGDPNTINDVEDGNCNCTGNPIQNNPAFSLYINSGGGAYTSLSGKNFTADQYFTGGSASGTSSSIANTSDDPLYQDMRFRNEMVYEIPVPQNGQYNVTLHWAEKWAGAFTVGKRVFDVYMENQLVESNLDVFAQAGALTALVKTFTVSVSDGILNIEGIASSNNAFFSAVEVESVGSVTPPALPTPRLLSDNLNLGSLTVGQKDSSLFFVINDSNATLSMDSVKIQTADSGYYTVSAVTGSTLPAGDTAGFYAVFDAFSGSVASPQAVVQIYTADTVLSLNLSGSVSCPVAGTTCDDGDPNTVNDVEDGNCNCAGVVPGTGPAFSLYINSGGGAYTSLSGKNFTADQYFAGGSASSTGSSIANTSDDPLYQDMRFRKEMAYEIPVPQNGQYNVTLHWAEKWSGAFTVGKRVFDVYMENQLVESNLDVFAQAGALTALVKTFTVSVSDGTLNIEGIASSNNAFFSAVEVESIGSVTPPTLPTPRLLSDNLNLGSLTVGQKDSALFGVVNDSNASLTIDSVKIQTAHPGYYTVSAATGSTLPAGDTAGFYAVLDAFSGSVASPQAVVQIYTADTVLSLNLSGSVSCPVAGTTCDDGDPNTVNDVEDGNCNCAGVVPGTGPAFSLYINSGGGVYTSLSGKNFTADQYFTGGSASGTSSSIANTSDDPLYQDMRFRKEMAYEIPVPQNGQYTVTLHWAEKWAGAFTVGKRVFDVYMENQLVESNLDVFAQAGALTALVKTFTVSVSDGILNIEGIASSNNAFFSAVEVELPGSSAMVSGGGMGNPDRSQQDVVKPDATSTGKKKVDRVEEGKPEIPVQSRWSIYPNPAAEGLVTWHSSTPQDAETALLLYNMQGQLLQRFVLGALKSKMELSLEGIPAGSYVLKWQRSQGRGTAKILIIK